MARYVRATPRVHWAKRPDRVSRGAASLLRGRNPLRALVLRQYRVSHLGAHAAQEDGHLAGRDRPGRRPGPGRVHVILVVCAGHSPIPAPPPVAARRMPLTLAGGGPAGALARTHPGIGAEERLAARTAAAADSGHRSPPGVKLTRYLSRPARSGWIRRVGSQTTQAGVSLRGASPDDDLGGMTRTGSHLVMDTVDVVESGHVGGVAPSWGPVPRKRGGAQARARGRPGNLSQRRGLTVRRSGLRVGQ